MEDTTSWITLCITIVLAIERIFSRFKSFRCKSACCELSEHTLDSPKQLTINDKQNSV